MDDYTAPQDRPRPGVHEAMYPLFLVVRTAPVSPTINERATRTTVALRVGPHEAHLATGMHPGEVDHGMVIDALVSGLRDAAQAAVGFRPGGSS